MVGLDALAMIGAFLASTVVMGVGVALLLRRGV